MAGYLHRHVLKQVLASELTPSSNYFVSQSHYHRHEDLYRHCFRFLCLRVLSRRACCFECPRSRRQRQSCHHYFPKCELWAPTAHHVYVSSEGSNNLSGTFFCVRFTWIRTSEMFNWISWAVASREFQHDYRKSQRWCHCNAGYSCFPRQCGPANRWRFEECKLWIH